MNILFNQRYQSTEDKIQRALFSLLRIRKDVNISIKELCYEAGINRSSFYAHYEDINDLMIKTEQSLSMGIANIFSINKAWDENTFVQLFEFLYKNRDFYRAYFMADERMFMERDFSQYLKAIRQNNKAIDFDASEEIYHIAFFAGGLKAMAKSWILNNCHQTPEQMAKILTNEYRVNAKYFS